MPLRTIKENLLNESSSAQKVMFGRPTQGCALSLTGLPGDGGYIYDRSGMGENGTITGAAWTRLPSGLWVLKYDGIDDKVSTAISNITGTFSLAMWVNMTALTDFDYIFWIGTGTGADQTFIGLNTAASQQMRFKTSNDQTATSTTLISTGQYYFVVATMSVSKLQTLYINGVAESTAQNTVAISITGSVMFGIDAAETAGRWCAATIGLPRVWNRDLTAAEITTLFNKERRLFGV